MNLQTTPLNGIKAGQFLFLGLFIFMVVCQFISGKLPTYLSERKAKKEAEKHHRRPPEKNKTGEMMQYYMIAMIAVFGLTWPAAMSLYWAINSCVRIVQTLVVQKIIDNKELREGIR